MCSSREVHNVRRDTDAASLAMRTNIEIDDELSSDAMSATGLSTKRATADAGLRTLVRLRGQVEALENLAGLAWEGDLSEMRESRLSDAS